MALFGLVIFLFCIYQLNTEFFKITQQENDLEYLDRNFIWENQVSMRKLLKYNIQMDEGEISESEFNEYLKVLANEPIAYKNAVDKARNKFEFENDSYKIRAVFLSIFLIFGFIVMLIGFRLWYTKIQKYLDVETKWKGDIYMTLTNDAQQKAEIVKEIIDKNIVEKPQGQGKESDS
ncbi:hypothetical protein LCGC14_1191600 [marine sediment metagenome]